MNEELSPDFVPQSKDYRSILERLEPYAGLSSLHIAGPTALKQLAKNNTLFVDVCPIEDAKGKPYAVVFTEDQVETPQFATKSLPAKFALRRFVSNPFLYGVVFNPSKDFTLNESSGVLSRSEAAILLGRLEASDSPQPSLHLHQHAKNCLETDRICEALYQATCYRVANNVLEAFLEVVVSALSSLGLYMDAKAEISSYREPGRNKLDFTPYEARMLTLRGFPNDAITKLKSTFTGFKVSGVAWLERARAQYELGQIAPALTSLDKLTEIDNESIVGDLLRAKCLIASYNADSNKIHLDKSLALLEKLLSQSHFHLPQVHFLRGVIFKTRGERDSAREELEASLAQGFHLSSYWEILRLSHELGQNDAAGIIHTFLQHYYPQKSEMLDFESGGGEDLPTRLRSETRLESN